MAVVGTVPVVRVEPVVVLELAARIEEPPYESYQELPSLDSVVEQLQLDLHQISW